MARRPRAAAPIEEPEDDGRVEQWAWAEAVKKASGDDAGRKISTPFAAYAEDPVAFSRAILGSNLWAGQAAMMNAVIKHRKVAVRSGRKVGKTFAAANLVVAFMSTAPTICIVTAPGERQVRENLFAKIRALHARAKARLPGAVGVQSLRIDNDWFAIGVAASDPENVLGFHAGIEVPDDGIFDQSTPRESVFDVMSRAGARGRTNRLLVVFDEAVGIEQPIFDAIEGSLSGSNVYALMLANPRMQADSGHYYSNAFIKNSGWYPIHISAEAPREDPVYSAECFHEVPEWIDREIRPWINEKRVQWGEESALFQSDVLGCFTTSELEHQIIPMHLLDAAAKWDILDDERPSSRHVGCDLAGAESGGGDYCVATLWINGVLSCLHRWRSPDTMDSISILEALVERWSPDSGRIPWSNVHLDATGVGKGAVDRLRQRGLFIDAVNFGSRARYDWRGITGEMKFRNRKAELFWIMRRALQEQIAQVPRKYQDVWRELQWHTHRTVTRGNNTEMEIVENKDLLRDRYGRSPDFADAAVLGWSRAGTRPTFRLVAPGGLIRP